MMKRTCLTVLLLAVAMLALTTITQTTFANPQAIAVLDAAGNPGGLAVVLDAGDGELVASLARTGAPLIVEGLETDPAKVATAQAMLGKNGLAGKGAANCRKSNWMHRPYGTAWPPMTACWSSPARTDVSGE